MAVLSQWEGVNVQGVGAYVKHAGKVSGHGWVRG